MEYEQSSAAAMGPPFRVTFRKLHKQPPKAKITDHTITSLVDIIAEYGVSGAEDGSLYALGKKLLGRPVPETNHPVEGIIGERLEKFYGQLAKALDTQLTQAEPAAGDIVDHMTTDRVAWEGSNGSTVQAYKQSRFSYGIKCTIPEAKFPDVEKAFLALVKPTVLGRKVHQTQYLCNNSD